MAGKQIYETDAVKAFYEKMSEASRRKYDHALVVIRQFGYLRAPEAEKQPFRDSDLDAGKRAVLLLL